jgi:biotin carboxylase
MPTQPTTVLLTGIGGPTPRAIARALKRHSQYGPYRIIATDCNPLSIGLYDRQLVDAAYVVPPAGDAAYWPTLRSLVAAEDIQVALIEPEVEVECWAERASLESLPCAAVLPPLPLVRALRDKAKMTDILADSGLVPDSIRFEPTDQSASTLERALAYPFWIRATQGTSGLGSYLVRDRSALSAWIAVNPGISEFLASQYLPGRNLACKLLYDAGMLRRAAVAERVHYVMAKVAPSGVTGNTSFGRLLNMPSAVSAAERAVEHVCLALGVQPQGLLTVDLKEDATGTAFVTEVNVRHVAFTGALAAAGANLVEDNLQLALGNRSRLPARVVHVFPEGAMFLREVDAEPIVMNERDLLHRWAPGL